MTKKLNKQESRNLAMNLVGAELEKEGYEFLAIKSDLKKNPQFVVIKDKITSFVLVRAVSNSEKLHDYRNITTQPILEHSEQFNAKVYYASLDHALWFHRNFKIDEWLLYAIESPSASNARGFSRGSIFDQNGVMVASVTQEGLMRKYK